MQLDLFNWLDTFTHYKPFSKEIINDFVAISGINLRPAIELQMHDTALYILETYGLKFIEVTTIYKVLVVRLLVVSINP